MNRSDDARSGESAPDDTSSEPPSRRRRRRRSPTADEGTTAPRAPASRAEEVGEPRRGPGGRRKRSGGEGAPRRRRAGVEPVPDDLPATAFEAFGLPRGVLQGIAAAGYLEPTEVQSRLIPPALAGKDVVARSRTGTGKTCAFLVPTLAALDEVRAGDASVAPHGPPRVLVVVPTRELAIQVAEEGVKLARFLPVSTACVYGGTRFPKQLQEIPVSAVVVGTPGRLLDHMGRRTFDPSKLEVVVLDEVDRMYDLGFRDDVDRILRAASGRRQTLLVSATLNDDVERLIAKHLGEHERVLIESKTMTVEEVEQTFYVVEHDRKRELLVALLKQREPKRTIVFVRTKFTADRVAYALQKQGFDAHEIHSGLPQRRREQILQDFRDGRLELLVATDVAARGLDIQGVDHVVNYDIPESAEDYVHRVGRTARMGQEGWAVTLVCPDDGQYLTAIEKLINQQIEQQRFPGFEVAPRQAPPEEEEKQETPRIPGIPRWGRPKRRR